MTRGHLGKIREYFGMDAGKDLVEDFVMRAYLGKIRAYFVMDARQGFG